MESDVGENIAGYMSSLGLHESPNQLNTSSSGPTGVPRGSISSADALARVEEDELEEEDPTFADDASTARLIRNAGGHSDAELERFRKDWEDEVRAKKDGAVSVGPVKWKREGGPSGRSKSPSRISQAWQSVSRTVRRRPPNDRSAEAETTTKSNSNVQPDSAGGSTRPLHLRTMPLDLDEPVDEAEPSSIASVAAIPIAQSSASSIKVKKAEDAVEIYARAVENEQSGQLNDALLLYRKAFKLNGETYPRTFKRVTLMCTFRLRGSIVCSVEAESCPTNRGTYDADFERCRLGKCARRCAILVSTAHPGRTRLRRAVPPTPNTATAR